MPDCYLVLLDANGSVAESILVECKCNLQPGSKSMKEPEKLFREVEEKFRKAQILYPAKEMIIAVDRENKRDLAKKLRGSGYSRWKVKDCDEVCVCGLCS